MQRDRERQRAEIWRTCQAGLILFAFTLAFYQSETFAQSETFTQQAKWKDYRNPRTACSAFDPDKDRALSPEFIVWDMKGMNSPIVQEEEDFVKNLLSICLENKVDPAYICAGLRSGHYGAYARKYRSVGAFPAPPGTPPEKVYILGGVRWLKFESWSEGLEYYVSQNQPLLLWNIWKRNGDGPPKVHEAPDLCLLILKMQYIDTKQAYKYKWADVWNKVDAMIR